MYLMLILSFLSYNKIRMNEFYKAGIAAQPLIQALENHKLRTKGYPKKLQDIFPEDLYSIHQTKIMGYPNLRYVPKNNSYKLILDCPIGILSPDFQYMSEKCAIQGNVTCLGEWRYVLMADSFEYWPGQNYPETIKRAQVVKLGKWVYIRRYD
ncbi:MAG: hypothetical protein A3J83_07380 [Elusimicrobia bacterium RIFOXYA2_FULL_40_6]|nr:MAG: hypothetical protein A3J83_07380 [Elusimicrobia bacterium RIFOXYA2_FULL_40_6]